MKKFMNTTLSLALILTLCTVVVPVIDLGETEETEEEGVSPLSDIEPGTDFHI